MVAKEGEGQIIDNISDQKVNETKHNNNCHDDDSNAEDKVLLLRKWQSIAKLPFGTTLLHYISLCWSPLTFWRISENQMYQHLNFVPVMITCASAIIVPAVGYYLFNYVLLQSQHHGNKSNNVVTTKTTSIFSMRQNQFYTSSTLTLRSMIPQITTYICSPYTMAWVYKAICKIMETKTIIYKHYTNLSKTNPPAWKCLAQRIQMHRAYRTRRYDVYLPPPASSYATNTNTSPPSCILFLPGWGCEHVAYSEIASILSDGGFLVAVVSMEPLRILDGYLSGSNVATLRSIQKQVEWNHSDILFNKSTHRITTTNKTITWHLAGHSAGALHSTKLIHALHNIRKLVMFGPSPAFAQIMDDISQSTSCEVQVIQASEDAVDAIFGSVEKTNLFWNKLPLQSQKTVHIIQGGTHQGFANYTSSWQNETGSISLQQQHSEAAQIAIRFFKQKENYIIKPIIQRV